MGSEGKGRRGKGIPGGVGVGRPRLKGTRRGNKMEWLPGGREEEGRKKEGRVRCRKKERKRRKQRRRRIWRKNMDED